MKRSLAASIAIVALFAWAPGVHAERNVDSGLYKGKTTKGKTRVAFRITKGERLVHFNFRRIDLKCSDGDTLRLKYKEKIDSGRDKLTVYGDGTFAFRVDYTNGGYWIVHGRVRGAKATGRLRMKVRFNTDNRPDPKGRVVCDSGKRKFRLRHR